jgi:hypothetical protein
MSKSLHRAGKQEQPPNWQGHKQFGLAGKVNEDRSDWAFAHSLRRVLTGV